jgi:murein DD-endopeptidase MepM/ murein hydrolase activator NlpD
MFLKYLLLSTFFLFVFSAFSCFESTSVNAFHAEVFPLEINQGDAFIIKVTDVPASSPPPVADFSEKQLYFSRCGNACFIALGAIEMKTKPGTYTINIFVGKQKKTLSFTVNPTDFPTLNLTLPDEKVFLSPENLKRAKKEDKKLQSLFQMASEKLWDRRFILPLANDFSTVFGTKRIMNKKRISIHRGLDIRGKMGETVRASNHGRVVLAEELFFGGNTVIIDHGQGIYTIYMHLSEFKVQPETIISKGDTIGLVGASGRATGPHLHFGVKVLNVNTNPVSIIELTQ